jgi:hypothetical protein
MSNRVEDLERQVAELQAAVNGLTEELVEMKERVRQVEDAQEVAVEEAAEQAAAPPDDAVAAAEADGTAGGERRTHSDDHVEVVERTDDAPTNDATADAESSEGEADAADDVIVPEQEATTPDAEAAKAAESEGEDDEAESDSDIIVA